MYKTLTNEFKNQLIDRKCDKAILISFTITFFICFIPSFILWITFKHWLVIFLTVLLTIVLCVILGYTIIFKIAKKQNIINNNYCFRLTSAIKSLKITSKKDAEILLPLLKAHGINSRPKVQEAIRHYQVLLNNKNPRGFSIVPIVSLCTSIVGIIFSFLKLQDSEFLLLVAILVLIIPVYASLFCIAVKLIYRSTYYTLSEYVLYERIEAALSEIWMNIMK